MDSRTSLLFDTFWSSIRQEGANFADLNLFCETNSSLASQDVSRYFGIHTIHNRVLRRERDHWEDLGVDGWIILGWISRRWDVGMWTGLGWPRIGTGGGRL